jgi:PAS domain S-box-containing protein
VLVYTLFAGAWVLLSDYALGFLSRDPALLVRLSAGKGLLFVIITGLLLYTLIRGYMRQSRRKENAIREGEARFRSYVEHAPMAVFVMDRDGNMQDFNPAAAQMFGSPVGKLCLVDLALDKDRATLRDDVQSLFAGAAVEREYSLRKGDGRTLQLLLRAVRLDDSSVLAFGSDVTEHRRVDRALRESEERYRSLVTNIGEGITIVDPQFRFIFANPAAESIFGVPAGELPGRSMGEFYPPEQFRRVLAAVERLRRGQSLTREPVIVQPGGSMRRISVTTTPQFDEHGEYVGTFAIMHDITDRTEAEAKLRDFIEQSPEVVALANEEGRIAEFNPTAERFTGIPRGLALGMNLWELQSQFMPPEKRTAEYIRALESMIRGALKTGQADFLRKPITAAVHSRDGTVRILEQHSFIITTHRGFQIGSIGRDITEEVTTAEALRKSEEQLQQARKMEAVGRLAGGIAHDFNNLLTVIGGYADLINSSLRESSPTKTGIQEIQRAAQRAAELTNQLLAFSRRQVLQPRIIDLNEIIRGMENMLRRVIGEDVELATSLAPQLGTIRADPGQIEQVMMNLAANARDAMPDGGRFTIETARCAVDQADENGAAAPSGGLSVCLRVSDSGVGMDGETLAKIFEPFFTTKEKGKGTGLGLATVYGIITQSGGQIRAESQPGKGSTFLISFPIAEEKADERRVTARNMSTEPSDETILLVEDEDSVRRYVTSVLQGAGYRVIPARDGMEAIQTISSPESEVHLLLSDVVMPMMSGPELGERARALCPGIRILYMSGYAESSIVNHGILDQGVNLIQKPFAAEDLLSRIRELLQE